MSIEEVREIVFDGIVNNSPVDVVIAQVHQKKLNYNLSFLDCSRCIIYAFLWSVPDNIASGKPLLVAIDRIFSHWRDLMLEFARDADNVDMLRALEEFLNRDFPRYKSIFQFLVHTLYDLDILSGIRILEWENQLQSQSLKSQFSKFIDWLRQQSDDSDDDEIN
jgi:hypothetical protein